MENSADCQFEVLRTVNLVDTRWNAGGTNFSGFVNSDSLSSVWLASGSQVRIYNAHRGTLLGSWSFRDGNLITCVSQLKNANESSTPQLLIGLSTTDDCGIVCAFDLTKCRVVKSFLIPHKITAFDCVEGYKLSTIDCFSEWDIIAIAGTDEAHVYMCDMTPRQSTSFSDSVPVRLNPVPFQNDKTFPVDTCVEVLLGTHKGSKFVWSDADGMRSLNAAEAYVTCVKYCAAIESLAVGYSFGCYQTFCLKSGAVILNSLLSESSEVPVVEFALQEPENDPKNVVYLWVVRGKSARFEGESDTEEESGVDVEMWQLYYDSKRISQSGYKYEKFESASCRYVNTLEESTSFVCCHSLLNALCNESGQSGNDSVLPDGVSVCDSSLIYFCWKTTSGAYAVGLFDLNSWYHAQMPSQLIRYGEFYSFFATASLASLPFSVQHLLIPPRTVKRSRCANASSDIQYYPVSLSYDCAILASNSVTTGRVRSIQSSIICEIDQRSCKVLDSPREMLTLCRTYGLLPQSANSCDFLLMDLNEQRRLLLTVMLENGCVTFLLSCVSAFCKVPVGLNMMTDWSFDAVSRIKFTLDAHNDILFDSGGLELAASQREALALNTSMLESVALVYRHSLSIAEQMELRDTFLAELSHRMATVDLIVDYARLLQWLIDQSLLPASEDGKAMGRNSRIQQMVDARRDQPSLANFLLESIALPVAEFWVSQHDWNRILPPPSYSALCGAYLIDGVPLGAKQFLTLYYLFDVYGDRDSWTFDRSESFNRRFISNSSNPWLFDFSLAVWLLDSGDFPTGKFHFLRALNHGGSWKETTAVWSKLFSEIWSRLGTSASFSQSLVANDISLPTSDFELILSVLTTAKQMDEGGDTTGAQAYLKRHFTEKSLVKLVDYNYDPEMEMWLKNQIATHGWNGLCGSEALFWFATRRSHYKSAVESQDLSKTKIGGKRKAEGNGCQALAKRLQDVLPECRYTKQRKLGPSPMEVMFQSLASTSEVNMMSADIATGSTLLCRTASEEISRRMRVASPSPATSFVSPLKIASPPKPKELRDLTQTLSDLFELTESGRKMPINKSKLLMASDPRDHRVKLGEIQSLLATPPPVGRKRLTDMTSSGSKAQPPVPILRVRELSPISTHSSKHLRFDLPTGSLADGPHVSFPKEDVSLFLHVSPSPRHLTDSFERVERWECATPEVVSESRSESVVSSNAIEEPVRFSPALVRPNLDLMDRLLGEAKIELAISAHAELSDISSSSHSAQEYTQEQRTTPMLEYRDENLPPPLEVPSGDFGPDDQMYLSEEDFEDSLIKPSFSTAALAVTMNEPQADVPHLDIYDEMFLSEDEIADASSNVPGLYDILEDDEMLMLDRHSPVTNPNGDGPPLQLTSVPTTPEVPDLNCEETPQDTEETRGTLAAEHPVQIIPPPVIPKTYPLRSRSQLGGVDMDVFMSLPIEARLRQPRSPSVTSTHSTDSAGVKRAKQLKLLRKDRRSRARSSLSAVGPEEFDHIADELTSESGSDGAATAQHTDEETPVESSSVERRTKPNRRTSLRVKVLRKHRVSHIHQPHLPSVPTEAFEKITSSPLVISTPNRSNEAEVVVPEGGLPSTSATACVTPQKQQDEKLELVERVRPITPTRTLDLSASRVLRSAVKVAAEPVKTDVLAETNGAEASGENEGKSARKGRRSPARPESPARSLRSNSTVPTDLAVELKPREAPTQDVSVEPAASTVVTKKKILRKKHTAADFSELEDVNEIPLRSKYPLKRYDREDAAAAQANGTLIDPDSIPSKPGRRSASTVKKMSTTKKAGASGVYQAAAIFANDTPPKMAVPEFSLPRAFARKKGVTESKTEELEEFHFSPPSVKSLGRSVGRGKVTDEVEAEKKPRERRRNTVGSQV